MCQSYLVFIILIKSSQFCKLSMLIHSFKLKIKEAKNG